MSLALRLQGAITAKRHANAELFAISNEHAATFSELLWLRGVKFDSYKFITDEVRADEFGLKTEHYRCGDTDYDDTWFPWVWLDMPMATRPSSRTAR